jgi:hypothetical protein
MTACAQSQTEYTGNGSQVLYTFTFPYITQNDISVDIRNDVTELWQPAVAPYTWSFANATTIEFATAPITPTKPNLSNIRIRRSTDVSPLIAQFNPGSAIRARDLNDNFEQLQLAIEENQCGVDVNVSNIDGVTVVDPQSGQILEYDQGVWVNKDWHQSNWLTTDPSDPSYILNVPNFDINDIEDFNVTNPQSGQILEYDQGTWVNKAWNQSNWLTTDPSDPSYILNVPDSFGITYIANRNCVDLGPVGNEVAGNFYVNTQTGIANDGWGLAADTTIRSNERLIKQADSSWTTFGGEYVLKTGDNMTGDLTLGTDPSSPNISLNADGTYVGKKSVSVDRTATSNPTFRGKLNGADTFKVLADGSATFAGSQVDFGSSAGAKIRFARPSDGAYSHALGTDLRFDASSDNNKFGLTNSGGGAQINVGLVSNGDSKFSVQTLNPGTNLYEEVAAIKYDGSAVFSDSVSIGGTLPSSPNISLNADGSTVFKGPTHEFGSQSAGPQYITITSGGGGSTGRFGYGLRNRPFTYSTTSNDANTFLCTGTGGRWSFRQNTDDWTTIGSEVAQIGGDGSATFAGDVSIGGTLPSAPNISLGDDGSISASGQIDFNLTAGEGVRLGSRYEDKTVYVGIDSNDAASTSQSWANSAYIGFESGTEDNILYRVNNYHKFLGANGSEAVVINADTSSTTFAGSVSIGGTLPSSPNISLDADGSATFASTNRAATYIQTADQTGNPSTGIVGTMLQGGTVLATRGGNINIWEGRAEGSTTITSSIKPDGSAQFAGKVTATSTLAGDVGTTLATKDYVDANGGGGGGDVINYSGASAWGKVSSAYVLEGSLNSTINRTGVGTGGVYNVVFTTPMPNANYSIVSSAGQASADGALCTATYRGVTANGFQMVLTAGQVLTNVESSYAVFATNALPPTGGTGTDAWASVTAQGSNGLCVVPGSFNVASVTRSSSGTYDVVFTTPMPSAGYAVTTGSTSSTSGQSRTTDILQKTAAGFTARPKNGAGYQDYDFDFTVNATNATLPSTFTSTQVQTFLDLGDTITTMTNRVSAIESGNIIDDATDSSLIQLIASLAARVTALESA